MGDDQMAMNTTNAVQPSSQEASSVEHSIVAEKDEAVAVMMKEEEEEDQSIVQTMECRICQEEDQAVNLENPCACNGTLKYVHRKCVQRWCNEKGNTTCEICLQRFEPGYTAPVLTAPSPPRPRSEDTTVDISGNWTAGNQMDADDPRLLAMAAHRRHFLEPDYEDTDRDSNGASFCRAAAFMLMALLLLRHALAITAAEGDNDVATLFALFMLRAIGFLLPCYIMAWAVSMIQYRRRMQNNNSARSTTEVAIMLQSRGNGDIQFTVAPNLSAPAPNAPIPPTHA
ncbi:hypothetical protein MKW94_007306 [Papaver nudicaule]|uniref:RING-CH-type domain-containing protein n=1 Tax=Papaver nudicaule TaxID=74823 RepID=A0AA41SF61_PAPNU|nr:hypothetical protein [Papaver nudicaule]